MDRLTREIDKVRHRMDLQWSPEGVERALARVHRGVRRRRIRRATGAAALAAAACLVLGLGGYAVWGDKQAPRAQDGDLPNRRVSFPDGSKAVLLGAETDLRTVEETAERVAVRLARGRSRFHVETHRARVFAVNAGPVTVTALGTVFTVERRNDRTGVWVDEGRVRVEWRGGTTELTPGAHGWFDDEAQQAAAERSDPRDVQDGTSAYVDGGHDATRSAVSRTAGDAARAAPSHPVRRRRVMDWRRLADQGRYDDAFGALKRVPGPRTVEGLLLAADVARLSDHPEAALRYLAKVAAAHSDHPKASLAAFTKGRVLLDLRRPAEAAAAFRRARRLSPQAPLAEDALAREVESWSRAGRSARARGAAEAYLEQYPDGRRRRAVRRFGKLE